MRIILILIAFFLVVQVDAGQRDSINTVRPGVGGFIATNQFGGSLRLLVKDRFGADFHVYRNWKGNVEGGSLQLLYMLRMPSSLQPYIALGGGVQRMDITDVAKHQYNLPVPFFTGGVGAELFIGSMKKNSIAFEAAYEYGKLSYSGRSQTIVGVATQTVDRKELHVTPFSIRMLYHFYLIPRSRVVRNKKLHASVVPDVSKSAEPETIVTVKDSGKIINVLPDSADLSPVQAETLQQPSDNVSKTDTVPVVEKVVEQEQIEKEIAAVRSIPSNLITFGANNSTLAHSSIPVLEQLVTVLNANMALKLRIEGHTDLSGDPEKNRLLSKERAERVKLFLINSGIAADRLSTEGFGSDKPVADNSTSEGRKKNRRVELIPVQ